MKRLAAVALALVLGCGGATAPPPVDERRAPLVVKRGPLEDRLALTGEVEAIDAETLSVPRTPSWMVSIRWIADEGTFVKKGDKVVEFDSSSFAATLDDKRLGVVRAETELESEQAKGRSTVAEKAMEVERKQAERDKARAEASVPEDLFPRRVHQEKQLALARAEDALAKAEDDLRAARGAARLDTRLKEVAAGRATRELRELEERLDELVLRAPRDGLVQIAPNRREGRKFLVGDQAYAGWLVASLPDLSKVQVRAKLSDVDDGAVRAGMRAECVLDAYPKRIFTGTIQQIAPMARPDGREGTRRFFDVLVSLDAADGKVLRPGMSVRVDVVRRREKEVLIVPRVAVGGTTGKVRVRLASGAEETVEVDWCTETDCAVRGGLLEGATLSSTAAQPPGGPS